MCRRPPSPRSAAGGFVVTPAAVEPRGPLAVLVAFGRPHTLIGTTLATVVLWAMALALLDVGVLDGLPTLVVTLCLLYTSPSPRDGLLSRMPSSA